MVIFISLQHCEANSQQNCYPKSSNGILSYKYVRLLESLPIEIDQLEKNIIDIESKLFEKNLYVLNNDKFNKLTESLSKAKETLDHKITEWLEVEAIKDKLEK
jgi:hypothetical protein